MPVLAHFFYGVAGHGVNPGSRAVGVKVVGGERAASGGAPAWSL